MGAAISAVSGVWKALRTVLAVLRQMQKTYAEVVARGTSDPGLPVANPTSPYWLDEPPFPELVDVRSPTLPREADVVVIGSGIAGAATVWSLLHESRGRDGGREKGKVPPKVVVLEARELCSGATGRNGGHIKASAHEDFAQMRKAGLAPGRAAEMVRFQLRHLDALVGLCDAEKIEVAEAREVETVDLFINLDTFEKSKKQVDEVRKWVPEFDVKVWEGEEAREKFGANGSVVGAFTYKSGAIWPYRFVTSIWKKLLEEFPESLAIETGTPVEGVELDGSDAEKPFRVTTSRGVVRARHVVHATNAYAGHLLPVLRDKLTSLLCHMSSQRPGKDFPDHNGQRSWSIIYASMGFEYVTQRPTQDGVPGDILLGGGYSRSPKEGLDMIGNWDDSKVDTLTVAHNLGIMPAIFEPKWGAESAGKARKVWSGVVATTADSRPLVGRLDHRLTGRKVPGRTEKKGEEVEPGEWIAAGFLGNGMVWAWLSGVAVGIMLAGAEDEDLPLRPGRPGGRLAEWVPEDLLASYERVKKMDLTDLADML
ncbi:FAD dependent oxidoreductase-domain-containing protein, partial [Coniochaeta sp. 2T2.1]